MDQPWSLFQLDEYIPGTGPVYNGAANMNYDSSMPSDLPPMNSFHTNPWIPSFKLWLEDSKPADFLAIRKTQVIGPVSIKESHGLLEVRFSGISTNAATNIQRLSVLTYQCYHL